MRTTSFDIPDDMYRRVNIAAASMDGMSSSEFIRRAIVKALHDAMESEPLLAVAFRFMDENDLAQITRDHAR